MTRRAAGDHEVDGVINEVARRRDRDGPTTVPRTPATLALHLQRQAGNRAVASLLAVQRDDDLDALDAANRAGGVVDQGNAVSGTVTAGHTVGKYYDPNASSSHATAGGVSTGTIGVATGGLALVGSSMQHHEARGVLATQAPGTAGHRAANRDVNTTGADVAERTMGTASSITSTVAGGMAAGGASAASLAGAIAAPLAVPLSILQSFRWARKAHHARLRVEALAEVIRSENATVDPKTKLAAVEADVAAKTDLEEGYRDAAAAARQEVAARRLQLEQVEKIKKPSLLDQTKIRRLRLEIADHEEIATGAERDLAAVGTQLTAAIALRDEVRSTRLEMERAVREEAAIVASGKTEQVSLRMIQAFAMEKNRQGLIKKAVNAVAGLLATGGGVAGTVAAIAIASGAAVGASALLATPIGWALAGMAAVIGLGMAGYSAWRFFSKRWERTGQEDAAGNKPGFFSRVGKTLAFWKSTGPSRRDVYAARLYELANDPSAQDATRTKEARATIKALGLDWAALGMASNRTASIKLIAAKMAS